MATLSAHLRNTDAHGALPFRADCPICREQCLVGAFASGAAVSLRAQAALAAGVLALTTMAPAALAAENDTEQDGTATVTQITTPDPSQSPDFDPGGSSDGLPAQAPALPQTPAPPTEGTDDTAAVDQQPATNPDDPAVDNGDGSESSTDAAPVPPPSDATATTPAQLGPQGSSEQPATEPTAPAPTSTAPPPSSETPTTPVAGTPSVARTPEAAPSVPARHHQRSHRRAAYSAVRRSQRAAPTAASASSPPTPVAGLAAASSWPRPATIPAAERAKPGDRTHAVRAGESLWSIASDLLGDHASPARIAREVNRLWQANRERIGTGNPDLLMVGTTLRLR